MANRNINDICNILFYIVRKERGVFLTYPEAGMILDNGQMELLADSFAQYQVNQSIVDALSPFKKYTQFTSTSSGDVVMPDDYQHLLGSVFTVSGSTVNPVRFVNEDELPYAITSQLRPVTTTSPIAIDSALGFQLYPQSQQTGFFTYLRRPNIPVCAVTQVGRVITYDPVNSVQIEFYDIYINNIISRALKYLGINISEADIEQFAQLQQQQTNP